MTEPIDQLTHDLRGPLSIVKGFMKEISGIDMSKDLREYYDAALRGVEKLSLLIESRGDEARNRSSR